MEPPDDRDHVIVISLVMNYHHDIPSIHAVHPALPAMLELLDLNREIKADTPIDAKHLVHAEAVAITLKGLCRESRAPHTYLKSSHILQNPINIPKLLHKSCKVQN